MVMLSPLLNTFKSLYHRSYKILLLFRIFQQHIVLRNGNVCRSVREMAASPVSSDDLLKKGVETPEVSGSLHCLQALVKTEGDEDDGEIVDKLEIDLSVKCRGCFVEDPEMHYLFTVFDQQLSLADILMQTTSFECKEDDGFPPYLCTKCTTCLIDFFNFKIQFQKTDIYVRTLLGKNIPVSFHDASAQPEVHYESDTASYADEDTSDKLYDTCNEASEDKVIPDIKEIAGTSQFCEVCNEDFETPEECETHMARDHGKNPLFKYHLFRKMIAENEKAQVQARKRKRYLEADLKEVILMNMPGKLCRFCRKKFPEDEFKAHWESHKVHVCEECGHKCIKKSDLDIHKQSVHNDIRSFGCSLCEKTFKTKQLLKRHQIVHLNPRAYCCDLCGQRFNDSGTLKTHVQLKHIGNRDFICPICGFAFPMKATLEKHILRHNKNRPPSFYCDVCSSAFKDKSSLKRHHLVKHSEDYVRPSCEHCGKTYCSNTKLRYHIERHHSGNKVERKKRGPKKLKPEEYSTSENSDSEESSGSFQRRRGPKVRNASENFYRRSPSYTAQRTDDDDPLEQGYFIYKKEEYESEDESESIKSESE